MKSIRVWLCSFAVVCVLSLSVGFTQSIIGDQYFYYQQAGNPFTYIESPFSGRILLPLLTYSLPIPLRWSFLGITLAALAASLVLLYDILRNSRIPGLTVIVTLLPMLLDRRFADMIHNYFYTDGVSCFLIGLAWYAAVHQKYRLFSTAVFFGVLNHEIVLMYVPFFYFVFCKQISKQSVFSFFLLITPALVALYLSRTIAFYVSDLFFLNSFLDHVYSINATGSIYDNLFWDRINWLFATGSEAWIRLLGIAMFGFTLYAPVVYFRCFTKPSHEWVRLFSLLIPAAFVVAVSQMTDRLLFFSFPIFILIYARILAGFPAAHQVGIGCVTLLNIFLPGSAIPAVLHFGYVSVLLLRHKTAERKFPESNPSAVSLNMPHCVKAAWNPVAVVAVAILVGLTIGKYYCASKYLTRFQQWIHSNPALLRFQTNPVQLASYSMPNLSSMQVVSTVDADEPTYLSIPIEEISTTQSDCISMVLLLHPIQPSWVQIEIPSNQTTHSQPYTLKFHQTNPDRIRISKSIYFEIPTTQSSFLIKLSPGLLLVDILFFDSSRLYRFQRKEVWRLNSNEIEQF